MQNSGPQVVTLKDFIKNAEILLTQDYSSVSDPLKPDVNRCKIAWATSSQERRSPSVLVSKKDALAEMTDGSKVPTLGSRVADLAYLHATRLLIASSMPWAG